MKTIKLNLNKKIDCNWNALERHWAKQYEEDYGNLFSSTILNNHKISLSASNNEAGMLISA